MNSTESRELGSLRPLPILTGKPSFALVSALTTEHYTQRLRLQPPHRRARHARR